MNLKHSVVFFSAGIILILGLVLMGIMPMSTSDIVPESQQNLTIDTEIEFILEQNDNENTLQDDDDIDNNPAKNLPVKPIEEMNCTELRELVISFEKGWGNATALHDEKCP